MFLATTNKAKRLLCLDYIGRVTVEDLRTAVKEAAELLTDLKPGFRVLADFTRMESMEDGTAAEIGMMMEQADKQGVKTVVRVISDPSKDIGLNILQFFHYKRQLEVVTCESMEDAAKALGI
jgi:hypothetical protein